MKRLLLIALVFLCKIAVAQNVGIGTLTPTSKLNVNGQVTIDQKNFGGYGGLLLKGDAPGNNYPNIAFTIKNNAATPVDVVGAMIQGDLQNNAAGAEAIDLTFLNSFSGLGGLSEKMRITANGNVGIGTSTPGFPLNFASNVGDKISLYGNAGDHYGFGIQGGLLQMHSGVITDDIAFGYGSSSSFNENMRIKGNGNVGIGTTAPQAYGHGGNNKILEIKNANNSVNSQSQLILSTGAADGSMGGITWAQHNIGTQKIAGFLGCVLDPFNTGSKMVFYTRNTPANLLTEKMTIDGNGHVGIGQPNPTYPLNFANTLGDKVALFVNGSNNYGLGIQSGLLQIHTSAANEDIAFGYGSSGALTERFRIKGNGALAVNSNTGTVGQLLTSNGGGAAASWTTPTKTQYFSSPFMYYMNAIRLFNFDIYDVTPATFTITVTQPSIVTLLVYSQLSEDSYWAPCVVGPCNYSWAAHALLDGVRQSGTQFNGSFYTGVPLANDHEFFFTLTSGGSMAPMVFPITTGTHTISFRARNVFGQPKIEIEAKAIVTAQ
jgi:hypothetical protein